MPPVPPTQRMGELHEIHVAEVLGGYKTRASGSQWTDPADGANHHDDPYAFRWDGKSTKGKSISLTLDMIGKIIEQAGGERPALPLRWYGNEALTEVLHDWIAVKLVDLSELQTAATEAERLRASLTDAEKAIGVYEDQLAERHRIIRELADERDKLRAELEAQPSAKADLPVRGAAPGYIPQLPWTVVHLTSLEGRSVTSGVRWDTNGHPQTFEVREAIVERSPDSFNRPRLMVNGALVPHGDLYVDGLLQARTWLSNQAAEVG